MKALAFILAGLAVLFFLTRAGDGPHPLLVDVSAKATCPPPKAGPNPCDVIDRKRPDTRRIA